MQDILRFLNSKDVESYWRKTGFDKKCTPQQAAFVIWNSRKVTLEDKFKAWEQLIGESDDCPVASPAQCARMNIAEELSGSLHAFLRAYIALNKKIIEEFYRNGDNAVYSFKVYYRGDADWHEDGQIYAAAEDCFAAVNYDKDLVPLIEAVKIRKQWVGVRKQTELSVLPDKTILGVDADGLPEEQLDLFQAFEWMWFNFPTPFKRGDIVVSDFTPFGWRIYADEPFVLSSLCTWGSEEYKLNGIPDKCNEYKYADERIARLAESGDISDMTAHGYFQTDDGGIYYECMHNYLDLEYYREKPQGNRRILVALSNFLKGGIEEELLLNTYLTIMTEEMCKQYRQKLSAFTKEGLRLAGFEE